MTRLPFYNYFSTLLYRHKLPARLCDNSASAVSNLCSSLKELLSFFDHPCRYKDLLPDLKRGRITNLHPCCHSIGPKLKQKPPHSLIKKRGNNPAVRYTLIPLVLRPWSKLTPDGLILPVQCKGDLKTKRILLAAAKTSVIIAEFHILNPRTPFIIC